MDRIFNMDNKFFVFMGRVADLIILNVLCIVCCIPIVTAGASITAMFYVTLKMVRNEETYIARSFFKSFKDNFKQATIINLIMIAAALLLYFDMSICSDMEGTVGQVLMVAFMVILILYLMIFVYIYPVLAKFYNTIRNTFVNAFLMSLRHLPYTILMILISAAPILVILFSNSAQVQSFALMLIIMLGFSTIAYCNSYFFVKIFDNYIPKEEEEGDAAQEKAEEEIPDLGTASVNISTAALLKAQAEASGEAKSSGEANSGEAAAGELVDSVSQEDSKKADNAGADVSEAGSAGHGAGSEGSEDSSL